MAAGQGFKTFTTGEVLTAADVNGYLMQGVGVFTDAANRDAEITSPQEGQFAYLKDTDVTTYYTGSAWTNLDTTGMVNPMTTTGDTIYSSSGSTPARLGIGSSGQVLTVSGGVPTWATSASGSLTLLSTTSLSGTSTTVSSISGAYTNLLVVVRGSTTSAAARLTIQANGSSTLSEVGYFDAAAGASTTRVDGTLHTDNNTTNGGAVLTIFNYSNTSYLKTGNTVFTYGAGNAGAAFGGYNYESTTAVTSIRVGTLAGTATFTAGQVLIYGVN